MHGLSIRIQHVFDRLNGAGRWREGEQDDMCNRLRVLSRILWRLINHLKREEEEEELITPEEPAKNLKNPGSIARGKHFRPTIVFSLASPLQTIETTP
ncbi:hypothetical protein RUM43_004282 [Polyplax serrata]|uniref:Uncharacterized protein n=1 Tax=Polyplax serrata TaxID=468196 RepID=A0AAN8SAQ1_POLSC